MEDVITEMLASTKAEALEWLRGGSESSFRNLGEMETTDESIAFAQRFYDLGAESVLACKIAEYDEGQNSGHLLIQLPSDDRARERLFAAHREHAESMGFEGEPDEGQEYLFMMLD
jgi:hypothetical protein